MSRPVIYQDWNHLLFLHWTADRSALQELLPPGLTLDIYEGNAWVGLIAFTITNSRPFFTPPIPFASDFHETNVRTYVRYKDVPGVLFFSLDAESRAATVGARAAFRLPYHFARMRMTMTGDPPVVDYESQRQWPSPVPATCSIRYRVTESSTREAAAGTLDHFLIERYVLYTYSRGRLYKAAVEHRPYPLSRAAAEKVDETLIWAAAVKKTSESPIVHYSRGVHVGIQALRRA